MMPDLVQEFIDEHIILDTDYQEFEDMNEQYLETVYTIYYVSSFHSFGIAKYTYIHNKFKEVNYSHIPSSVLEKWFIAERKLGND